MALAPPAAASSKRGRSPDPLRTHPLVDGSLPPTPDAPRHVDDLEADTKVARVAEAAAMYQAGLDTEAQQAGHGGSNKAARSSTWWREATPAHRCQPDTEAIAADAAGGGSADPGAGQTHAQDNDQQPQAAAAQQTAPAMVDKVVLQRTDSGRLEAIIPQQRIVLPTNIAQTAEAQVPMLRELLGAGGPVTFPFSDSTVLKWLRARGVGSLQLPAPGPGKPAQQDLGGIMTKAEVVQMREQLAVRQLCRLRACRLSLAHDAKTQVMRLLCR